MIFYFTATGNSLYIAKELDGNAISIPQELKKDDLHYQADSIGIVCPIFGHEMPENVREFLQKATFETDYFYLIETYGNRHGGAAELAQQFTESIGKPFDYINVIKMVDNFLPGFDMDEQMKLDKHIPEQLEAVKNDIDNRVRKISEVTDADRQVHAGYLARQANVPHDFYKHLYRITNDCVGCGICMKICPRGCFHLENQQTVWNSEKCVCCMACVHACPQYAIKLNMPEPNPGARYINPNIKLTEIIKANNQTNY